MEQFFSQNIIIFSRNLSKYQNIFAPLQLIDIVMKFLIVIQNLENF